MLLIIANVLAALISLGLIFIGVRFLVSPAVAAAGYGVPAKENGDAAYLSVKGARDVAVGILGLVLVAFGGAHATGLFMLVMAIIPLADAAIVLRNGGSRAIAFGVHLTTAAAVLIDAALLLLA
jgi:hypothetical protein